MALTKVSTDGVKDDAITKTKIPANQIEASELADNAVDTNAIADQAVALSKLPHGDGSSDGKFLRANNGADPTFETVSTDLVADTSPQLGGDLDTNSHHIALDDSHAVRFGANNDLEIYHDATDTYITNDTGDLYINNIGTNSDDITIKAKDNVSIRVQSNESAIECFGDGAVELYHDNAKRLETQSGGIRIRDRLGVNCDPNGSHPMQVDHDQQYIIAIRNTAADSSNFPWLCHKEINSTQAFAIHINGISGDPFHVDQNGGIFLNKETATANRLGDYEEGTYTPTPNSGTANTNDGQYTKIGNFCIVTGSITPNNNGTGGAMVQVSLPFTAASGRSGSGVILSLIHI